eukprot:366209-Chlamydomonas_euryale.AAC.15
MQNLTTDAPRQHGCYAQHPGLRCAGHEQRAHADCCGEPSRRMVAWSWNSGRSWPGREGIGYPGDGIACSACVQPCGGGKSQQFSWLVAVAGAWGTVHIHVPTCRTHDALRLVWRLGHQEQAVHSRTSTQGVQHHESCLEHQRLAVAELAQSGSVGTAARQPRQRYLALLALDLWPAPSAFLHPSPLKSQPVCFAPSYIHTRHVAGQRRRSHEPLQAAPPHSAPGQKGRSRSGRDQTRFAQPRAGSPLTALPYHAGPDQS